MSKTYENVLALDTTNEFQVPKDFFSALNEVLEIAGDQATLELDAGARLYLFEFSKITKKGWVNNPFVTMEWPGIQIPLAIASNLLNKLLKFNFITAKGNSEEHLITFYERNLAGRGLYFTVNPESKDDFLRYAVELQ